jgi:sirohydrochlorin cobaltochelatase
MSGEPRHDGLLLIAHGTRDALGLRQARQVAALVAAAAAPCPVRLGFLELAAPGIDAAYGELASLGVREIAAVPLLLLTAGHARRDIPCALQQCARASGVPFRQCAALECHRAIVELSERRFRQSIPSAGELAPRPSTALVLVARGNRDQQAQAQFRQFAALRAQRTGLDRVEACYFALARPTLEETLDAVARQDPPAIVVQPHLLFAGAIHAQLIQRVQRWQAARRATASAQRAGGWNGPLAVCEPLGVDQLLVEAVLSLWRGSAASTAPAAGER